jgi:hypothetical protein
MPAFLRAYGQAAGTWQRFLAVRAAVDPDGVFLNDFLREWFEIPRADAAQAEKPARREPRRDVAERAERADADA